MSISNKIRGLREIWNFDNRWYLALTRVLFPNEAVNVYKFDGLEILIDHSAGDANGARDVFASDMYSRYFPLLKLPQEVNVIDLGANNGGFPLLLKSRGIKIKKSLSVELNPHTFSRLRFNLERNFDGEAAALNAGVCGESRLIEINLGKGSVGDSLYQETSTDETKNFVIQGKTFDEIYEEHFAPETVDICKLDIEGAEFEIIGGGNCERLRNCQYLVMEIHHGKDKSRQFIRKKLGEMNFEEIQPEGKDDESLYYVHLFENRNPSK